jgi:hypothetical protein
VFDSGSLENKKGNNGPHNCRENSALGSGYALLRTQESSIHYIRNTVQLIIALYSVQHHTCFLKKESYCNVL